MKFSTRALAVLLALLMIVGTMPMMALAASVSEFSDFPSGTWSDAALTHAVNNGILRGKGDGRIAPKDYITRAEVAAIINRAFGATVKADISGYTDVDSSKWYYSEIQKAVNMQTVVGVSATEINPEGYITRESVFTILARAMVLSSTDSSGLSRFVDAASVSSWSLNYTNALVNRGHINGDEKGYINPGAYITREEFAQLMYNIFKTYLPEGGAVKDATYGTTVVRGRDLTLENLVINGDLVVADGVGNSNLNLKNVKVSGRILFRGGEGKVTIDKKSTVGEFVIVHDVNGTVNFNNYKTEAIFKGIVLDTKATFLGSAAGGGGGGGGGGGSGGGGGGSDDDDEKETYTIIFDGRNFYVTEGGKIGNAKDKWDSELSYVLSTYKAPAGYVNNGFKDKATGAKIDLDAKAEGNIEIIPDNTLIKYDVIYDAKGGTVDGLSTYTDTDALDVENAYTLKTSLVMEKAGYIFAGWYLDNENDLITTIPAGHTADVTVYAKWVKKAQLTFGFNNTLSDDTTVAIDVVLDAMPFDADAITSIILNYEYIKSGTTDAAELTYKEVKTSNGSATGDGSHISWTGNITSAGTLFTIVFTKDKSVGYDVDFKFGDVTIKNVDDVVEDYEKKDATINVGTGKTRFEIIYNGTKYYAYEDEKIGDAADKNGNKLSGVLGAYTAPAGYTNNGFKNKLTDALVNLDDTATESMEIVPNNTLNKYDVIYDANGGTVNASATYKDIGKLDVEHEYELLKSLVPKRSGYVFAGWYMDTVTETVISKIPAGQTGNVTLYAKWVKAFEITYNGTKYYAYEGDKIGDAADKNGNKLSGVLAAYTAPAGYTNFGFKNKLTEALVNLNAVATESIEIVPNNVLNKYDVIYDANGGTINGASAYTADDVLDVNTGYTLDAAIIPVRSTYKFLGWYIDTVSQAVVTDVPAGTQNVTVYAKWEGAYVVTYDGIRYFAYEGDKIGDAADADGNKLSDVLAAYIAPAGYTNNGFKNKATNAAVDINSDITADLEIVPDNTLNKYDVIYDANGGTVNASATYKDIGKLDVEHEYELLKSLVPKRSGYVFAGWYMDTATETVISKIPAGQTGNVTLYAKWVKAFEITYNGTKYYAYEGDKIGDAADANGNKLSDVLAAYTAPAGYTNFGFKNKLTEALVNLNDTATESIEIVPNNVLNKYDVIYDANGGTINGASAYTADDVLDVNTGYTLDTAIIPVRSTYKFLGWYIDTVSQAVVTDVPAGTQNVTVYAKWEGAYVVTYDGIRYFAYEGDKIGDATDADGNKLSDVLAAYIAPAGYTNNGFKNKATNAAVDINSDITADLEIVPDNTLNKYDVIYDANGGTINGAATYRDLQSLDVAHEYELLTSVVPTRYGHDFEGWYMNAADGVIEKIPAGQTSDVTVYAQWKQREPSVLDFSANVDKDNKKVTLKVTLSEVPHDIDEIESMTIYYTQTPAALTYVGTNAASGLGGSFIASEGVITWYNASNPLTRAELKAMGNVLFEITYTYDASVSGDIVFAFTDATEIGEVANGSDKIAADYTKDSVTINLERQNFDVIYDANGGTINGAATFTEAGVLYTASEYTLNTSIVPTKYGHDFEGWYMNAADGVIEKIPAGQTSNVTVYAQWKQREPSVLDFIANVDKDNKKVTLKLTLSEVPHDIDEIESMTIYYTQTPAALTYVGTSAASVLGGSFIASEGVISWYNASNPLTRAELKAMGNVLFEITYTYDAMAEGDIVFAFADATEIGEVAGGYDKIAADYTKDSVTINLQKSTYTITFGTSTYEVVYGSALSSNEELKEAMEAVTPSAGYKLVFEGTYEIGGTVYTEEVTPDTVPSADMTITFREEPIEYTIKYYSNGEEVFPGKKTYTVKELPYTLPVLDNTATDVFGGWYTTETFDGTAVKEIEAGTTGELVFYAKWESEFYTVTFYEGTKTRKGSYEVEALTKVTQSQVDALLGAPETYTMQEGYTDSDGNVHEIAPELWYQVNGEWEKFVPEDVVVNRDIDVYLFTRFAKVFYETDFEIKGIKIPGIELTVAYDSNTDLLQSRLDALTAMGRTLETTLAEIEAMAGVDLFQAALGKAAKTGLIDAEGNILNPQVPVPLHRLITEELIMQEIDRYIDNNINDEEFIAEILRNDTVVDMLLDDEGIRTKVLSDTEMRNKLLTDAAIKRIISKDEVIDWIITNEDFKKSFIDSDATFEYILGDLKALLDNAEYHDMLIDACVEFVIDVYFEKTVSAPELVDYIDSVLDSDEFIADIEAKPELRSVFKAEIKGLFADLNKPETSQDTREDIYEEIRKNDTIQNAIIDAIKSDEAIMDMIMKEVRDDLASANSEYRQEVIDAVRAEFADTSSDLKKQITETVKNDIALGAASALRGAVITAVTNDFALGDQSALKSLVIDHIEGQIAISGSALRESVLDEAATPGSTIADYVKSYVSSNDAIKSDIKAVVESDAAVKAEARSWINTNIESVKSDIETAIKTDIDALAIAILESGYVEDKTKADSFAADYISGALNGTVSDEIDSHISTFFADSAKVLNMVDTNFDVFYEASYDTLFDELYADADVFDTAYASYVSDRDKLEEAFDDYISDGANLTDAIDAFIAASDNLEESIETFVDGASDSDIASAIDTYIADDDNLVSAINLYIANDDNLKTVFDIFSEDDANFKKAFTTYIGDDDNLGDAIDTFVNDTTAFDTFYETHLGENAADPDTFNALFEAYYHTHVHDVAEKAWDNADLHDLVMQYVHDYTEEMVVDYANGTLDDEHPELVDTIDDLMHNEFPASVREMYYESGSTIKDIVDHLIEEEGTNLIKQYANNEITDAGTVQFIEDTIDENIGIIVDEYVDGTLDDEVKALVDAEIDSYMTTLIDDYIANRGDARKTLGDLIPTYAQDAVDSLKQTDAFRNTISDFVSGNGVRVNEGNIMFISILADVMAKYDYDKIMADFAPAALTKLVDKLGIYQAEKYVNALLGDFVASMNEAKDKMQADIDADIEGTEYKFSTTVPLRIYLMKDFVEAAYNKAMPKLQDKLLSINAISVNPYATRLVEKNWLTEVLDYDASKDGVEMSGYSIKKGKYNEEDDVYSSPLMTYYDINLKNKILLHDAIMWYSTTYEIPIEEKLNAISNLLGRFANKANDAIMTYITTGELPKGYTPYELADKVLDKLLGKNGAIDSAYGKVEDIYYAKEDTILNLVDKLKNFYAEKLDKDYSEVIDLAGMSVYADGEAYPIYKIILGLHEENKAFNIDTLAAAVFDSDNYYGINVIEKAMAKVKSKINGLSYTPAVPSSILVRDAYKVTVDAKQIKGYSTGSHTVGAQRYFQYIK